MADLQLPDDFQPVAERVEGWGQTAVAHLPDLAVAIVVLLLGLGVAALVRRGARRALLGVSDNVQVAGLLSRSVWLTVVGASLFLSLGVLGLDKTVTSLLAGAGVIGLAIGFAAQTLAANAMSGVIIAIKRPYRIGEWIDTDGEAGRVEQVDLSVTTLRTPDGRMVRVPNRSLLDGTLTNLSRTGLRRIDVAVGCAYGDDVREAIDVTREAIAPLAQEGEEAEVFATGFGGSSIDLVARLWAPWSSPRDSFSTQSDMIVAIKEAWDEAGITIPFPIRTLDFGVVGGVPLHEETIRVEASALREIPGEAEDATEASDGAEAA